MEEAVASEKFRGWLRKGLGRAILFLQTHEPAPYRDDVLYACTHQLAYDRQVEDSRSGYLFELMASTGDLKFFRDGVLAALRAGAEDWRDTAQLYELARIFAERGDDEARRAMYAAFPDDGIEILRACGCEFVRLDGLEGLLFVAEILLKTDEEEKPWHFQWLMQNLEERDGKESARQSVEEAVRDRPELALWVEAARECEDESQQNRGKPPKPRHDYAAVRRRIEAEGGMARLPDWGKGAPAEELEAAADDLLRETDNGRLVAYLRLFQFCRFPRSPVRLIALARGANESLACAAADALRQVSSPEVRGLALDLIQNPQRCGRGMELLVNNAEAGDFAMIETLLEQPMDEYDYHLLEIGVQAYVRAHLTQEAERSLVLLYENGPCGLCREECVEHLIALNRLPDWMRAECRYDASPDIRALAI